jgi:hypothetical protein
VALCQARISTKPLWGFSSSNPYHSQSRAEHPHKFLLFLCLLFKVSGGAGSSRQPAEQGLLF